MSVKRRFVVVHVGYTNDDNLFRTKCRVTLVAYANVESVKIAKFVIQLRQKFDSTTQTHRKHGVITKLLVCQLSILVSMVYLTNHMSLG